MALTFDDALLQLADRSSVKRRSAAKALRRLADHTAGPSLLEALAREVKDERTWETQYQMVMALAECRYMPALEWLRQLAGTLDDPLMLAVGVGHAVVRLGSLAGDTDAWVRWAIATRNTSIADGAFRALAMTGTVPGADVVQEILTYLAPLQAQDGRRFWVATAAVDWEGEPVKAALRAWSSLPRKDVADAARASLIGEHRRHSPL